MLMRTDPFRKLARDTDHIQASYDTGVLTLRIPIADHAKPRKIAITSSGSDRQAINA